MAISTSDRSDRSPRKVKTLTVSTPATSAASSTFSRWATSLPRRGTAMGIYATSTSGPDHHQCVRQHRHQQHQCRGHQRDVRRQCHHQLVRQYRHARRNARPSAHRSIPSEPSTAGRVLATRRSPRSAISRPRAPMRSASLRLPVSRRRVTTFGNIATRGDFAAGISVEADTSTVISNADIATEGHDAGIVVQTEGLADVTSTRPHHDPGGRRLRHHGGERERRCQGHQHRRHHHYRRRRRRDLCASERHRHHRQRR